MAKFYYSLFLLCSIVCIGQNPADRDPTFNMFEQPLNQYFVDNNVQKIVALPDGKIMLLDGNYHLVKLDNNLLDNSFQLQAITPVGSSGSVILDDFCVLPDGKIIIVGRFDGYAGQTRRDIARLNPDGSLDTSFNYNGNVDRISSVVSQPGGSLYIHVDTNDGKVIRLNANGTTDTSFATSTTIQYSTKFALQPDGKLLVFHTVSGNSNNGIHKLSRLNTNGSVDATFTTATFSIGAFGGPTLNEVLVQQDGKILVGGHFFSCNSVSRRGITRLNADGTLDSTFNLGNGFQQIEFGSDNAVVSQIVEQPDHKLLVGGTFVYYNNISKQRIVRLNPDASIDETFQTQDDFINMDRVNTIALLPDNHIFLGGNHFGRNYDSYLVKLMPDGSKDNSSNNIRKGFYWPAVLDAVETQEGKILAVGNFYTYNDKVCRNFIRLNSDGAVDPTLTYGGLNGFYGPQYAYPKQLAECPDGKIYIAGNFETYNGAPARSIIRINPDGTRDMSFDVGNGLDYNDPTPGEIADLLVAPDGGVLVAGGFRKVTVGPSQSDCSGLIKYSSTGLVYFYPLSLGTVTCIKYQTDGKLLAGGSGGIYRFDSGTTFDSTFALDPSIVNGGVSTFYIQPDGKILLHGSFTIGGVAKSLARINTDGSLDNTFNCSIDNATTVIETSALLPDGKIMITHRLEQDSYGPMCRLNNDGSLDTTFEIQPNMNGTEFLPLTTGKLLLYGYLDKYQNQTAYGMVRLTGEDYSFIQGQNRLDSNLNGCDVSDPLFAHMKYVISSGSGDFDFVCDTTGNYLIGMKDGAYNIIPTFENPSYFSASPPSVSVNFPSQQSPVTQQFCVTPVGNHPDLETILIPLSGATPGFDATYELVFKNKGNLTQSGTVSLAFNDAPIDLSFVDPAPTSASTNMLTWNFSSLLPYETRSISLKFYLNSPIETPPLSSGSILPFTASVTSPLTDDMPQDNVFTFSQTVVNSYDPNDKTCLQGASISTSQVGDFVHYVIRFENNGTAPAKNITVRDMIDTSKYDINTLVPILGSHLFTTRIVDGNLVEFIFEDINLPFANETNDGFVSFKIRTKSSLVVGDSFSNSAGIYFDYNFPVNTNTATTTVQELSAEEFENPYGISVYPNPSSNILNIANTTGILIKTISLYNLQGQLLFVLPNATGTQAIDISRLSTGTYIAVFASDDNTSSVKFIKN
ncbi:MAG: T9SS type A sorting domain-containing protein [Flavobacterium sp.]|nr:MAG: T9SS type A sorting domain-containing protein [Flavobacterium sp.]